MLGQNSREEPNFVERVVERRRRGPDHVRLAEIALHASGFQFLEQLLRMIVRLNRELATMLIYAGGRDDGQFRMPARFDEELKISGKLNRFRPERFHSAGFIEDRE